jgi:uncharacterized repeat protein (TIGR01451 family)
MSLFSFFRPRSGSNKRKAGKTASLGAKLLVEALEDRFLPSTAPLGILFGLNYAPTVDAGEMPMVSAPVETRDAGGLALNAAPALGKIQLFGIDTTPYINPALLITATTETAPLPPAPATLSGYVYYDANNNGAKDSGEVGIAGSVITLTGTGDQGQVSKRAITDANGFYQFTDLQSGTYSVAQDEPAGWLDGKDSAGSTGGNVSNDQIAAIDLVAGSDSTDNNFGELQAASLSGFVYLDANNSGTKDPGEAGIPGVAITLTGFSDQGPVVQQASTDPSGFYQFTNLRPGTYALTETQPTNYVDGKDSVGSQGGAAGNDNLSNIVLPAGTSGINNDFGEQANADLSIVKTVSAASVPAGSPITYTLTVANHGVSSAQNVQVLDTLPAEVTYQSAAGAGWAVSQAQGTVTATLPSLDAGASAQVTVTVTAPATAATLSNTATVSATTPDNNPTNNTSTATTTVVADPGTVSQQDIVPLGGPGRRLPALGKIQLFGIDTTPYVNPALLNQLAL